MRLIAFVAVTAIVCASPLRAEGGESQEEREARVMFKEATRLMDEGQLVEALEMFKAAYLRSPNPKILLNMGSIYRQLGRYAEAMDAYEKYVADSRANAKTKKEVEKILLDLAKRVGYLRVDVNEPGAKVTIDGKLVGESPQAIKLRVDPGTHSVIAEKDGASPAVATVTIKAGEERVVELRLAVAATKEPEEPKQPEDPKLPEDPKQDPADPKIEPDMGSPDDDHVALGGGGDDTDLDATVGAGVTSAGSDAARVPLGALVRFAIDTEEGNGGALVVGVTYGIAARVELSLSALVSDDLGLTAGGALFLASGAWRPMVVAGIPVFFVDGTHVGVHGGAGVQWQPNRRFGAFVELAVEHFFSAPAGFDSTLFVPSIGVQARL